MVWIEQEIKEQKKWGPSRWLKHPLRWFDHQTPAKKNVPNSHDLDRLLKKPTKKVLYKVEWHAKHMQYLAIQDIELYLVSQETFKAHHNVILISKKKQYGYLIESFKISNWCGLKTKKFRIGLDKLQAIQL